MYGQDEVANGGGRVRSNASGWVVFDSGENESFKDAHIFVPTSIMTPFEAMLDKLWLPRVRSALK